jgi:hypothetical protein
VARCRISNAALLRGAGLLLAIGAGLWRADATAQTAPAAPSTVFGPLDPSAEAEQKPPLPYQRFRKTDPRRPVAPRRTFDALAAAGAGVTGFDSTNARKKAGRKPASANANTRNAAEEKAIAPGIAAPAPSAQRSGSTAATSAANANANAPGNAAFAFGQPGDPTIPPPGPIQQPLKKRKATAIVDPYEPLGIRSGGLLYYPAVELYGGYDSNPARLSGGRGAAVVTAAPELRVQSDWARHELKADLRGSYTWYNPDETPTLSRPYFNGKVDGRIDVNHNSRIDVGTRALVSTDNPNSPNLPAGLSTLPVFATFGGYAGYAHRFNRLELGIKGDVERTAYEDSKLTDGTRASNADRNYDQYGGTLRAAYELSPGLTPFIEGGGDSRQHDLATDLFGYQRNSTGTIVRVGSTFEFSRLLTGEAAIGYVRREYVDPRLEVLQGLIGDASLTWAATTLTNVKFTAQSTVGESTVPGVSGVLYRDAGVQVDHAFRRWLIGSLKGGYGQDEYVGSPRIDNRYYVALGLTYKLSREWQVKGEARRQWLFSNEAGNSYAANIFLAGLRWQY